MSHCAVESQTKCKLNWLVSIISRPCLIFDRPTVRVNSDGSVTLRIKIFAPCSSPPAGILNREDVSLLWQFEKKQKKEIQEA